MYFYIFITMQLLALYSSNWVITRKTRQRRKSFSVWSDSDFTHVVLLLIMKRLGVVDFIAFSGVCKSWRSLALSNRTEFMASKPPMATWICSHGDFKKDSYCYLEDYYDGRKFKTIIPHSGGMTLCGLTCGYLILFGTKTRDFWLVNPITRHELHFPDFPFCLGDDIGTLAKVRAILVFSPSMCGWVFVIVRFYKKKIWFSTAGKGAWNHVSSNYFIRDLHAFKGMIYAVTMLCNVCELRLNPEPQVILLKTKNVPQLCFLGQEILSSGENLYVIDITVEWKSTVLELDTIEMKWVKPKKTIGYAYFASCFTHGAYAMKSEWWPACPSPKDYFFDEGRFLKMWYFPHDCLTVNYLHE